MSNINQLVYECLLLEEEQKEIKNELHKHLHNKKVKEFTNLSTKFVKEHGNLSEEELSRAKELFEDPGVKEYLGSVEKVAKRDSWIYGSATGGTLGGIISFITAGLAYGSLTVALALGALGAVLAGVATSLLLMPIFKLIRRWKAEDQLVDTVPSGVRIHRNI